MDWCVCGCRDPACCSGEDSRESCRPTIYKSHCPTFYRRGGLLKHIEVLRCYAIMFLLHEVNSLSPLFFFFEGAMVCLCYFQEYRFYESPFFLPRASSPYGTETMLHGFPSTLRRRKGKCLRHSSVEEQVRNRRKWRIPP